jgi:hypothetical protein
MFVQVITGHVSDAAAVRAQLDKWVAEIAPSAEGWLGSTAGVTDDGQLVAVARFESEEAAQRNSDRPEQGAWWDEMAKNFTDEPVFQNSTNATADTYGDPSQSTFVQVMQGRTSDAARARELMNDDSIDWAAFRPDILASLYIDHEGGAWTMVNYFTSEAEAREAEKNEPPAELQAMMGELDQLSVGEPTFIDLKDPWLNAPG